MARILVVEDDGLLSKMYKTILTNSGHEVELASDGEEGLAMAIKNKPEVILLDVMMPKLHGPQVLEKLKANPTTLAIPVIMLSGMSRMNDAQTMIAAGAAAYVDKGEYDPKRVAELVAQAIAGQLPAQSAASQQVVQPQPSVQPPQQVTTEVVAEKN